jgi:glycosyltransferase involved in cell wall biosynthesis
LKDLDPPVNYRIVGRTHPVVLARSGKSYREMLEGMVRDLELENVVEFVDRYLDEPELMELVRTSDLVVVPYDNHVQVSSGVIADAVGLGRPVVATRFPHAVEMLGDGAGEVVDHDPEALAQAIRRLLEDPNRYVEATKLAAAGSEKLNWVTVAGQYAHLIQDLAPALATA